VSAPNTNDKEKDMTTIQLDQTKTARTELAQRTNGGIDVTLFWEQRDSVDSVVVSVSDRETGAYFEIAAEPQLALKVYYHPFAYRSSLAVGGAES
jgi:hypothetical protein